MKLHLDVPTEHLCFLTGEEKLTAATEKVEMCVSSPGKGKITIPPTSAAATAEQDITTSGTFVKVSPSMSPVSFEEIGASYVEPMSLPSTPPLLAEPLSSLKNDNGNGESSSSSSQPVEDLTASSTSFVAITPPLSESHTGSFS